MSIWHQLRKNKGAIMGLVLLVVIIVVALGSPYLFDYETQVIANNIKERMQPPSAEHWFGTDDMGRDIFARVCYGARYSLAVGIIAVMFALVFGVTLGAAAGYIGGVFEDVTMRVCDIFSSIPSVLMAIAVVSALGKSTFNLMLAVGIASTAPFVRVARAAVLTIRGEEYIESARAIGVPEWQIVATHILPNCVSQIIVPFMAISYVAFALILLFCNLSALPGAVVTVITSAFAPQAALGGVIGILIGDGLSAVATAVVSQISEESLTVSPTLGAVLLAFGISVGIGILFGYLPANKAARLNPIDALHYD